VAREAVRLIVPASQIVTQVVDVTRDRVILRLNVAAEYQPEDVEKAKAMLLRRTGKDVEIDIRRVAGEDDLRLIRESLASRATQSPVDPLADLPRVGADLFMRVEKALSEAWPVNSAPRSNAEVAFDAEGMLIRVRYQSERDLAPPALEAITIALRSKLRNQKTRVEALREVPAAAGRRR
jgi:hypothetical protein